MPNFTSPKQRQMFVVSLESMGIDIESFHSQLGNYVDSLRAQGFTPEEILATLEAERAQEIGIFKTLSGDIQRQVDVALNRMFQLSSNEPMAEAGKLVQRVLNPAAEHCDTCQYLASLPPMPIEQIEYPGMQATHGETNCAAWCKCTIEPVEEVKVAA